MRVADIRSQDSVRRQKAVLILGKGDPTADRVELLVAFLMEDPSPLVRSTAAVVLGRWRTSPAVPGLRAAALYDPSPSVRGDAAEALGLIGDTSAVGDLVKVLGTESNGNVRREAARALGDIGDRAAVPHLIQVLDETEWGVGRAAWLSLRRITGEERPCDPAAWGDVE